ncbi:MAG: UDP-3-O-(3-hydroxymyristoyl)glucosamine N-acyltransferase [Marinilabiliales bacterium]|nr:MAG: UDP-3-O-(3-hydroxymyristoyl)glucosamine N-acyltransferase [Marinilabiliales bacterium]
MDFPHKLSVKEIAEIINGRPLGDIDVNALGLNELHVVREGDVTFVDHPKYYNKVLNSRASVVIINKEVDAPEGKTLILHDQPFNAFNILINKFRAFKPSDKFISESAIIGENTFIQPGAFIGNNVKIGDNCIIHSNVSVYDNSVIGNNVIIHSGSIIGADAYYFQKRDGKFSKFHSGGRAVIEDNVEIGANCCIDKGVTADTIIGCGTKFDNHCQVGHDTIIGKNCLIGAFAAIAGVTKIEDDVIIWARVAINKDIVIGKGAEILATSAIDKSVEGGITYMGSPAIEVKKYWRNMIFMKQLPDLIKSLRDK